MNPGVKAGLLELAEEPGLWIAGDPASETIVGEGYCVVTWGRRASVERIRLGDVEQAVTEVRALARDRGIGEVTWWAGDRSTPTGLADRLLACGLVPDDEVPELTSLTIDPRPGGESRVDVRRVTSFDDYLRAVELDWTVWRVPEEVRAERRAQATEHWERIVADGRVGHYLALIDGELVGFGRAVFTPLAAILMGGATLPSARGRGVYTSLVHARWDEAVERGTPRIAVSAGAMSTPILVKLGFEPIGRVLLLTDSLASGHGHD